MTSRVERLAAIRIDASRRRVNELEATWERWERGGAPGSSIPQGSRSANHPAPKSDQLDVAIRRARRSYDAHIRHIENHLDELAEIESAWIPPNPESEPQRYQAWCEDAAKTARAELSASAAVCANPNCARDVARTADDPMLAGRCTNCYAYWKRHLGEKERPKVLCDGDIERELAVSHGGAPDVD